ncbi:hypothetical protein FACS1894170_05730 [Planctomycetales bacterium]|nr:hypothetical protein FACS1894170_05730 [Planctomycetales bacterium]
MNGDCINPVFAAYNPMNQEFYDTNLRAFSPAKPLDYEDIPVFGTLPELLQSFQRYLGLNVQFIRTGGTLPLDMLHGITIPVESGYSPGQLAVMPDSGKKLTDIECSGFLKSFAGLLGETYRWQQALRSSEEQVLPFPSAAVSPLGLKSEPLTEASFFDVLKQSARLLDCCAAALYRLNPLEKTLKACSVWGLPEERLLENPRPLHDSLADVEAVLGQSVVLNEDYLFEVWQPPEFFPMAMCVPMITSSKIFGTLWLYSDIRRDLTEHDFELLEYVAGRITAHWELIFYRQEQMLKVGA